MKFSKATTLKLGFYVYALVDPHNSEIFYVGKGYANNRAFSHLAESRTEPNKNKRISAIRQANGEPIIEILRHGIESEKACFDVEATVIDAIGIENLTNAVRGHSTERGRQSAIEVERLLGSIPIDVKTISERYMVFFIHQSYSPTMTEPEVYDCTRQSWYNVSSYNRTTVDEYGKLKYSVALAVVDSIVVRVYSILAWFPAGSTLSSRLDLSAPNRWEFIGQKIDDHHLLNRRLTKGDDDLSASQMGFTYIN